MVEKIRLRACALIKDGAILLIDGFESGETFVEAVKREANEEACIDVEVGSVAFVYEYQPTMFLSSDIIRHLVRYGIYPVH